MRRKIVAANWKMNGSVDLVKSLVGDIKAQLSSLDNGVEIVIIPPALYLADVKVAVGRASFSVGMQNIARWGHGAYTGEIAAAMAADVGCDYVLIGHSERRQLFGEQDGDVAEKIQQALGSGLNAILCVGETLSERDSGQAEDIVCRQVKRALDGVSGAEWDKIIIAYEPVWAIGTGKTATAEDAQRMHQVLRNLLAELGAPAAEVSLLYGGSVKPDNAAALFAQPDIDGGLIGGASLVADDFVRICLSV